MAFGVRPAKIQSGRKCEKGVGSARKMDAVHIGKCAKGGGGRGTGDSVGKKVGSDYLIGKIKSD